MVKEADVIKKTKKKKWIPKNLKKGALTETASKEGAVAEGTGNIMMPWLRKKAKGKGKTAKRAKLAIAFRGFKKG